MKLLHFKSIEVVYRGKIMKTVTGQILMDLTVNLITASNLTGLKIKHYILPGPILIKLVHVNFNFINANFSKL